MAVTSFMCAAAGLLMPGTAAAACAGTPAASPHAFVGTVERTESAGRLALVRTEDGREVTVRGGETRDGVGSSNDRTYEVGATYEFHPLNDTSPFQDGACTATRVLTSAAEQPAERGAAGPGGSEPTSSGPMLLPVMVGASILLVVVLILLLRQSTTRNESYGTEAGDNGRAVG